MDDEFTFWRCFYCDGDLTVSSIFKEQVNVKCNCGSSGFIYKGKLYLNDKPQVEAGHR